MEWLDYKSASFVVGCVVLIATGLFMAFVHWVGRE